MRPWQGGGGTGQDEAFPVTGSATRTHMRAKRDINIYLCYTLDSVNAKQVIAGTPTPHSKPEVNEYTVSICLCAYLSP